MAVILQASSFLTSLDTTKESIAGLEGKLCTGVNSSCRVRGLRARAHRRVSSQTRHPTREGGEKLLNSETLRASPPCLSALPFLHFSGFYNVGHSTSENQHIPGDRAGPQPWAALGPEKGHRRPCLPFRVARCSTGRVQTQARLEQRSPGIC